MNNNNGIQSTDSDIEVTQVEKPHRPRGFAAMSKDRVREIASKGGKSAHLAGTAHVWTPEQARIAGKRGGIAPHKSRGKKIIINETISPSVKAA
jgi:general stress protein YciG